MRFIYKFRWVALLVLFATIKSFAQKPADEQLVEVADEVYLHSGAKTQALEQYLLALQINPDNTKANYMAGICYLHTIRKEKALDHFLRVYQVTPEYHPNFNVGFYPDLAFLIAQSYHYALAFDKATEYYALFRSKVRLGTTSKIVRSQKGKALSMLDRKIYECGVGKELVRTPIKVKLTNETELNSPFPDFGTSLAENGTKMYFTSRRSGGKNNDVDNDLYFYEDIYESTKEGNVWSKPVLTPGANSKDHESCLSVKADGSAMLLYKNIAGGDIYISRKTSAGRWADPKSINVNSPSRESSAFISKDGRYLFFTSDRPGGYGGMDIYVSEYLGNERWSIPYNLGPKINSELDEESPVLADGDKVLYFCSKGHKGMGGYDIFKSSFNLQMKEFGEPENLGYPINTPDNDCYFTPTEDPNVAYYSTVKETGQGDIDIYKIQYGIEDAPLPSLSASLDEVAKKKLEEQNEAKNKENEQASDKPKGKEMVIGEHSPEGAASSGNQQGKKKESPVRELILGDVPPDATNGAIGNAQNSGKANQNAEGTSRIDIPQTMRMDQLASNDQVIAREVQVEVEFYLEVKDRFTKTPLDVDLRLRDQKSGTVYKPEKVQPGVYNQKLTSKPNDKIDLSVEAQGYSYENKTITIPVGSSNETMHLKEQIQLEKIVVNKAKVLRNVYFGFNADEISEQAAEELRLLENFIKSNPKVVVEIGGHTDKIGMEDYNKMLSKQRAQSVVDYLVSKGVPAKRITAKGYGSSKPLATNDDEQEGRELNRRTEFKVLSK